MYDIYGTLLLTLIALFTQLYRITLNFLSVLLFLFHNTYKKCNSDEYTIINTYPVK